MKPQIKVFPAEFKADAQKPGEFEGIISVFGNVDHGGDRVVAGAFSDVIAAGQLPAIFWNHAWNLGPIGESLKWEEREKGLWVRGALYLDTGSDLVKRVHAGMKSGQVREFSFAYDTSETRRVTEQNQEIREIIKFSRIYEVGPVVAGMNPETELLQVAGLALPSGAMSAEQLHRLAVEAGAKCQESQGAAAGSGDTPVTMPAEMAALLLKAREEG